MGRRTLTGSRAVRSETLRRGGVADANASLTVRPMHLMSLRQRPDREFLDIGVPADRREQLHLDLDSPTGPSKIIDTVGDRAGVGQNNPVQPERVGGCQTKPGAKSDS